MTFEITKNNDIYHIQVIHYYNILIYTSIHKMQLVLYDKNS